MVKVLDASIIDGWLLMVINILGVLGFVWLLGKPSRRFFVAIAAIALPVAIAVTFAARWYVEKQWRPVPEPIPDVVYVWSGVCVVGLAILVTRLMFAEAIWRRVVTVCAAGLVVLLGVAHVNSHFGQYPTLRAALGLDHINTANASELSKAKTVVPLSQWRKPSGLPAHGTIATVTIPASASQFAARAARVYLPPAYSSSPRPRLPVLLLLAGQPGAPSDWLVGARLADTMDDYAAAHDGVAPLVIVADGTGTAMGNPLCMNSDLGNAATYLTTDVTDWATGTLDVDVDRAKWAVGGLSYGGTCALQLVTNYPDQYPTFLDMSGQLEPTLGDRQRTIAAAFGGDNAKFVAVNPADLMRTRRYPTVAGVFVVGADDREYRPGLEKLYQLAKDAGMDVRFETVPGGHSFPVWAAGLKKELPWLAGRLGLADGTTGDQKN